MLKRYKRNVASQNGEDGIVERIFAVLGVKGGRVVEVEAYDGYRYSNAYHWWHDRGFYATLVESNPAHYAALRDRVRDHPKVTISDRPISGIPGADNSLDNLLKATNCPPEPALLSIDLDGPDYAVWASLQNYSPKVVIVEANSDYGPTDVRVSATPRGSSAAALVALGREKGYELVAHCGNCVFVRRDLFEANREALEAQDNSLETLWDWPG